MQNINSKKNDFVTSCTSDKAFSIRNVVFSTVLATEILNRNTGMEKNIYIKVHMSFKKYTHLIHAFK